MATQFDSLIANILGSETRETKKANKPQAKKQKAPEKLPVPEPKKESDIKIIFYSEKAIAVIGQTKPFKDLLGKNGLKGIFNYNLSCGPGWIFPKSRLSEVEKALGIKAE